MTHFPVAPLRLPEGAGTNREISPVQVGQILGRFARQLDRVLTGWVDDLVQVLEEMIRHIRRFGFKQKRRKHPNVCHALHLVAQVFDLPQADCQSEGALA